MYDKAENKNNTNSKFLSNLKTTHSGKFQYTEQSKQSERCNSLTSDRNEYDESKQ